MKIKDLKRFLIENNISDDAEIVIWADHAQNYEFVDDVWVTRNTEKNPNELVWEFDGYEDVYDEDAVEMYPADGAVTAVCFGGAGC